MVLLDLACVLADPAYTAELLKQAQKSLPSTQQDSKDKVPGECLCTSLQSMSGFTITYHLGQLLWIKSSKNVLNL